MEWSKTYIIYNICCCQRCRPLSNNNNNSIPRICVICHVIQVFLRFDLSLSAYCLPLLLHCGNLLFFLHFRVQFDLIYGKPKHRFAGKPLCGRIIIILVLLSCTHDAVLVSIEAIFAKMWCICASTKSVFSMDRVMVPQKRYYIYMSTNDVANNTENKNI